MRGRCIFKILRSLSIALLIIAEVQMLADNSKVNEKTLVIITKKTN